MTKKLVFYEHQQWDGGDGHYGTGICFTDENEMKKFMKTHPYDRYATHEFTVYDSVEDYEAVEVVRIREKALAKLTKEELTALGLI